MRARRRTFNSDDLEGNPKGKLSQGIGSGDGDWRLELSSALDLEVLSYIRTTDGFLTAMHDVVPASETGHQVAIFNPGSNPNQVSRLRLINPGSKPARVSIEGIDDAGESSGDAVVVTVPAGATRTVSAKELEAGGRGLAGMLGRGKGKWQLVVSSGAADRGDELAVESDGASDEPVDGAWVGRCASSGAVSLGGALDAAGVPGVCAHHQPFEESGRGAHRGG